MENNKNLILGVKDRSYLICKKLIWLYIVLLIFEGALRKWLFPSLSNPLLLVRDPIVVYLVIMGIQKRLLDFMYVKVMMIICTVSFAFSLLFGHHNILVGLFGWRIYFFHFPMIFIIGQFLNRDDILAICRFLLYLSIPMTILIVIQYYSTPTAWVNIGVGGEDTAGFGGANGYMRPPGVFSFTQGYIAYQGMVGCTLFYYLIANKTLENKDRIPDLFLILMLVCYIIAIPVSISRTNLFQTILFLTFFLFIAFLKKGIRTKIFLGMFIVLGLVILLYVTGLLEANIDTFIARFEGASNSEGNVVKGTLGKRYLGGFLSAFLNIDTPFWGYGIGLGTNAGSAFLGGNMFSFGFNGEVEWQRIIGECGYILGILIIGVRLLFSIELFKKAFYILKDRSDILPWMLTSYMIIALPQGQWAPTTNLGFTVLSAGLTLAAIRTSK